MPATDNIFKVQDEKDGRPLPEKKSAQFHYVVAQLFFASGKVLQGLQTEVAFLTTRVKAIDEDDWGKLQQVMK